MTWWTVGTMAGSAILGYLGSQDAANAQVKGLKQSDLLQQQNRNMAYTVLEPNRMLGYQAGADLSSLYGYATPGYTPLNQLLATGGGNTVGGGGGVSGGGNSPASSLIHSGLNRFMTGTMGIGGADLQNKLVDPLGLFGGGGRPDIKGTINTQTGTVDSTGNDWQDNALTQYLRTGQWPEGADAGSRTKKLRQQIDALRQQGYTYTPGQAGDNGTTPGTGGFPGAIAPTAAGAPSMSRFFTSPDYTFRQQQGQSALDRSAAARGGALSGNAIAGGVNLASNLASGEYSNYVNRLLQMAGLGSAATTQVIDSGQNYANNAGQNQVAMGDARASGVMGGINSIGSAANSYLNYNLWQKYLNGQGSTTPANSLYGPYSGGYQFPG